MQRVEIDGYLDSVKADIGSGVMTISVKAKLGEIPSADCDQLAEYSRLEMILGLEISPRGKDATIEVDGKLFSVKADLAADILTMTYRIMRSDIDTKAERILGQAQALHIPTTVDCSSRQKSMFEGTALAHAHVELRAGGG